MNLNVLSRKNILWFMAGITSIIFVGCAFLIPKKEISAETEKAIYQAEIYFHSLEDLKANEAYPLKYQKSQSYLEEAKTFGAEGDDENAAVSAENSLSNSRNILKSVVLRSFRKEALSLQQTIKDKGAHSSLKDLLPRLDSILEYAERVENGQKEVVLNDFISMREQLTVIEESIKRNIAFTLNNDISFSIGSYQVQELSRKGRQVLEEILRETDNAKKQYMAHFEGKKMLVKINVTAYTDQLGFKANGKLKKKLMGGVKNASKKFKGKRKFLNQRLSQHRADAIGNYLLRHLKLMQDDRFTLDIVTEIKGLGEALPPGLKPPFPKNDPRRRVSFISSYCMIE